MKRRLFIHSAFFKIAVVLFLCNGCPLLLAPALSEPLVTATAGAEGFWLWTLLGRLHPMAVHFPVTLLCLAAILEVATWRNFNSRLRPGIDLLVLFGALGAVLSAGLGWLLAGQEEYGGNILAIHRWTGVATAGLGLGAALLLYGIEKKERWQLIRLYRGVLLFTAIGVTAAGHYGASLTHGEVYLTSVMPWSKDYEKPSGEPKTHFSLVSVQQDGAQLSQDQQIELNVRVRAIFAHSCYKCHSADKTKGELRLDQKDLVFKGGKSGPLFVPGQPDKSEIVRRITLPRSHKESMPGKGKSLTEEEVALITFWIKKGAPWPDAGQKGIFRVAELRPRLPALPAAGAGRQNPVDRLVNAYFKKQHLSWPGVVSDKVYLRRIYLDIIGIAPTPAEMDTFARDSRPDKRAIWVRQLLNRNDDYAMHWLTFWNDALRNDYSGTGYITKGRFNISDWLYKSLATNKPYNQFVRELLNPTDASKGFIKGIKWRGAVNSSQRVEMQAAQNVSQVLLGLNLKCASCHDSFVSDWKLEDAYAFANVFADTTLEINRCDVPTGKKADTRILWKELGTIDKTGKLPEKLRQMSELLVKPENGRLYRTLVNRVWAQMMGRGIVTPVDEMDNEPWSQDLLDWLASDFVARNYDIKELIFLIATSQTYQLPSVGFQDAAKIATHDFKFRGMLRRRMSAEQFADAVSLAIQPVYSDSALQFNPYGEVARYQEKVPFVRASLVRNDGFLTALGRPNRETVITSRDSHANLLQALELTNGKKFNDILRRGAHNWIARYQQNDQLIRAVYRQALGREPQPQEFRVARQALGATPKPASVQDFLWAIVLLPEFQLIY
jgi:uncharacterized membrane protein/mono/diheme cytochrome c family protein